MTFVIKDSNQSSDPPVEASLSLDAGGYVCLLLNDQKVLSVSPVSGRLLLAEKIPESLIPGIALDDRGAIRLCPATLADYYRRS